MGRSAHRALEPRIAGKTYMKWALGLASARLLPVMVLTSFSLRPAAGMAKWDGNAGLFAHASS